MASLDDLLSQIPIDQLASKLGVDEQTASQAARAAVPVLVGGMEANAKDPEGAASLAKAVSQHDDALLAGGVDLDQVDTDDGARIVKNVFGDSQDQVVNALGGLGGSGGGGSGGLDPGMIGKVLPMLAPLVMSFLAKSGGGGSGGSEGGGGGLSDMLGGLLGGGGGGGGLGDMLGGLLGGGGGGGAGGIGDVLGGLLGGGKR